jgi:hypothetical protein
VLGVTPPFSDESRVVASKDQVSCDLAGEAAILNLQTGVYFGLDPVGADIWKLLQEPRTVGQIRDAMLALYEVDPPTLDEDIRILLNQLAEHGLIDSAP